MRISDTKWTPKGNDLTIACLSCHLTFTHPSNRFNVRCPRCGRHGRLGQIRETFAELGFFKTPGNWEGRV